MDSKWKKTPVGTEYKRLWSKTPVETTRYKAYRWKQKQVRKHINIFYHNGVNKIQKAPMESKARILIDGKMMRKQQRTELPDKLGIHRNDCGNRHRNVIAALI